MLIRPIFGRISKRVDLCLYGVSYLQQLYGKKTRICLGGNTRYASSAVCNYGSTNQSPIVQHVTQADAGDDQFIEHEVRGEKLQGVLWILLHLHAANNNPDTVFGILKKAENERLKVSNRMVNNLLRMFIKNNNTAATLQLHTWMKDHHTLHTASPNHILGLCTLLVEAKRGLDALTLLKEYKQLDVHKEKLDLDELRTDCKTLLNSAANTCDYMLTQNIFDELMSARMIQPENYMVVPLLQCRLNSGDVIGTVEAAAQIYKNYKVLPKRMEILIFLLKDYTSRKLNISIPESMNWSGDSDDALCRMMSLVVKCYGQHQASHDLFFACIEADCPSSARLVLEKLVEKVDVAQMKKMCGLYGKEMQEKALLHILNIFKPRRDALLRQRVYSALLDVYVARGDETGGRKALNIYWAMTEEDLIPSPHFLASLTSLLTALDITLPPPLS